ncbi:MAG: hypothetical protein J6A25_02860 [Lachnospiraceae bacterium]|nr:hypothetical protein [Lachnospiraceae bacterium]
MSLRGGYQIINLDNREFSTSLGNTEKYEDIYKNLLNSHAKFIVLSGLNMDGIKWGDREAIFYEQQNGDGIYFQAELRRIWNTSDKTCTTKYINIYSDDTVKMTVDTFIYEPDNDKELNDTSTNAVENKVIKAEFGKVYYLDGSQKTTAPLNLGSSTILVSSRSDPIRPVYVRGGDERLVPVEVATHRNISYITSDSSRAVNFSSYRWLATNMLRYYDNFTLPFSHSSGLTGEATVTFSIYGYNVVAQFSIDATPENDLYDVTITISGEHYTNLKDYMKLFLPDSDNFNCNLSGDCSGFQMRDNDNNQMTLTFDVFTERKQQWSSAYGYWG